MTVFGVTTMLLTSLPVRGSDRTTDVIFPGRAGKSAPHRVAASNPPIHIVEQKRTQMFRMAARPGCLVNTKSNGIISV
jgi:hypothetical protein